MKRTSWLVVLVLVVGAAAGLWWWRTHRGTTSDKPATPTVTQGSGSGSSATPTRGASAPASDAPAHVAITVRDAGGPLANAAVRAAPGADGRDDVEVVIGKTGADGVAHVDLAPGAWSISASAPDHVAGAIDKTVAAGESASVVLVLASGGRILAGTITDASGGPIGGARIDAARLGTMAKPDAAIAMTLTGADGTYKLAVPEGQVLVAASQADYAPQARYVDVGPAGATADFALVPGGVIEGIVLDERTKTPVGGARVVATRDGDGGGAIAFADTQQRRVEAGADGKFRIGGLRPGAYELGARLELRVSRAATKVGLGVAEQLVDVEILVGAAPVVRGKVIGERGLAVADVQITVFGASGGGDERAAKSGVDGTFVIAGLPTGRYMAMGQSHAWLPDGTTPLELADKDLDGVVVHVRPAARVVGHVEPRQACEVRFDLDPDALRDGSMPMLVRPTHAGVDGNFALEPVSPGKGTIGARCPSGDQGSAQVEIKEGGPEVVVKVTPGASIAGKVVDGDGKPVSGVAVMATAQTGSEHVVVVNGMITSGAQALTGAGGAYEVRGLTAGTYRLAVLDRGRPLTAKGAQEPTKVTLAASDHKTGVDLAVEIPNGTIKGTVVGADGKPLADAWVSVRRDFAAMMADMHPGPGPGPGPGGGSGEARMMTIEASNDDDGGGAGASEAPPILTDATGKFEIHGLSHGKYLVLAEAQAGKLRGRAPDVTPDATITIAAVGLTTLHGTVKAGAPLGVFSVELDGPTRTQRSFTAPAATPNEGAFELGRVDPGDYVVRVTSSAGNGEVKVTVAPNAPANVEIVLVANAVIVGKVVDAKGAPAANIGVAVVPDTGDGGVRLSLEGPPPTTTADGTFRVEVKAGKSVLILMTPPKPTIRRGLVLEAGKTLDAGTITIGS